MVSQKDMDSYCLIAAIPTPLGAKSPVPSVVLFMLHTSAVDLNYADVAVVTAYVCMIHKANWEICRQPKILGSLHRGGRVTGLFSLL